MTELLPPRDDQDPFCSCPKCELLASHDMEERLLLPASAGPWYGGALFRDGRYGYGFAVTWEDEDTTPEAIRAVRRCCVFCGHPWYTHPRRASMAGQAGTRP